MRVHNMLAMVTDGSSGFSLGVTMILCVCWYWKHADSLLNNLHWYLNTMLFICIFFFYEYSSRSTLVKLKFELRANTSYIFIMYTLQNVTLSPLIVLILFSGALLKPWVHCGRCQADRHLPRSFRWEKSLLIRMMACSIIHKLFTSSTNNRLSQNKKKTWWIWNFRIFLLWITIVNEGFSYLYLLVWLLYVDMSKLSSTPNPHRLILCIANILETTNIIVIHVWLMW